MTERRNADLSKQLGADCWLTGISSGGIVGFCVCVGAYVCVGVCVRQIGRKRERDRKTGCVLPSPPVMHFSLSHNWILKIHGAALYMWCQDDSRHLPLLCCCGIYLFSIFFAISPHTFAVLSPPSSLPLSVLLSFGLLLTYAHLLFYLSLLLLYAGKKNKESKMSIAANTYRG